MIPDPAPVPRPSVAVDIVIEADGWPPEADLASLAEAAIDALLATVPTDLEAPAEVAVVFTDDDHMRVLNRRYRGRDAATDVLSFPGARHASGRFGPLLGDIVLAHQTVSRDAAADGLAIADHITHLIVHGFLHLIGYDHQTAADATVMEGLEAAILARLGVADPFKR